MPSLVGNEILYVQGLDSVNKPAAIVYPVTTQQIANLGGGSGAGPTTRILSGTSYTTEPSDTFLLWDTATPGSKTTRVVTDEMIDGQVLTIKDKGAGDYANTISAFEGGVTIEGQPTFVMNSANGEAINLKFDAETNDLMVF